MLEVELKFRADSLDRITADLVALGALAREPVSQIDQYFAHPCRDFGQTDEALRIRRIGERNFVTYKGPKEKGDILLFQHAAPPEPQSMPEKVECPLFPKTRREIELPLARGEAAAEQFGELLVALGF